MIFTNYVVEDSFEDKLKNVKEANDKLKGVGEELSNELKKARELSNEMDKELDEFYSELKKIYPAMN